LLEKSLIKEKDNQEEVYLLTPYKRLLS